MITTFPILPSEANKLSMSEDSLKSAKTQSIVNHQNLLNISPFIPSSFSYIH